MRWDLSSCVPSTTDTGVVATGSVKVTLKDGGQREAQPNSEVLSEFRHSTVVERDAQLTVPYRPSVLEFVPATVTKLDHSQRFRLNLTAAEEHSIDWATGWLCNPWEC